MTYTMVLDIRFHNPITGETNHLPPVPAGEYVAIPDFSNEVDEVLAIQCRPDDRGARVMRMPGVYAAPDLVPKQLSLEQATVGSEEISLASGETALVPVRVGDRLVGTLALAHAQSPGLHRYATSQSQI